MAKNLAELSLKFIGDTRNLENAIHRVRRAVLGTFATELGIRAVSFAFRGINDLIEKFQDNLGQVIRYVIEMGAEFEKSETSFQSLVGSVELGSKLFNEIVQLAAETPFLSSELLENARMLLGYGVAPNELLDTMKRLGDIAAGTGGEIGRLALAYGQVITKGKLTAEEVTRQLGNLGIGTESIAQAVGMTGAQLSKMMADGKAHAGLFVQAIKNMTDVGGRFYGMTNRLMQTAYGSYTQLMETIEIKAGQVGKQFFQDFPIAKIMQEIARSIQNIDPKALTERLYSLRESLGKTLELAIKLGAAVVTVFGKSGKKFADEMLGDVKGLEDLFEVLIPRALDQIKNMALTVLKIMVDLTRLIADTIVKPVANMLNKDWREVVVDFFLGNAQMPISNAMWLARETGLIGEQSYQFAKKTIDIRRPGDFDKLFDHLDQGLVKFRESALKAFGPASFEEEMKKLKNQRIELIERLKTALMQPGGVPGIDERQQLEMAAAREFQARQKAFFEAMEKAMPGFRNNLNDLMADALSIDKNNISYQGFMEQMAVIKEGMQQANLTGYSLEQYQQAAVRLYKNAVKNLDETKNKLPEPGVSGTELIGNTASTIISRALSEARTPAGTNNARDIVDKIDLLRRTSEQQLEYDRRIYEALEQYLRNNVVPINLGVPN